jgi:hypothetical protein
MREIASGEKFIALAMTDGETRFFWSLFITAMGIIQVYA